MLSNIFKKGATGWVPDADDLNAPDGALLRATNIIRDQVGGLVKRQGATSKYTGLTGDAQATGVHSLYSAVVPDPDGNRYYFAGSGEHLYVNGSSTGEAFDGSGDLAFGDDSYQVFAARGTTKKAFDGTNLYDWSITAPATAVTLTANTVAQTIFFNFASTGDTAIPAGTTSTITVHEGTRSYEDGHDGTADAASQITPDSTGKASVSKVYNADVNCLDILTYPGGPTDLFNIYVWLQDVKKFTGLTLMFGLGTGTDPFKDDYYAFTFQFEAGFDTVAVKNPEKYGFAAYDKAAVKNTAALTPEEVTRALNPTDVKSVMKRRGIDAGSFSKARPDSQQNSPAWTHFVVPRGMFERIGSTSGRDWKTVRGIKVVYNCVPGQGANAKIRLDDLSIIGGGDAVLTGDYQVVYRYVYDNGVYQQLSPCSPISNKISLAQQSLSIQFPAFTGDPQVNQIWVYLYGGLLDRWYRVSTLPSTGSAHLWGLDEFAAFADGSPVASSVPFAPAALGAGTNATHLDLSGLSGIGTTDYTGKWVNVLTGNASGANPVIASYDTGTKIATVANMSPAAAAGDSASLSLTALTNKDKSDLHIGMAVELGAFTSATANTVVLTLRKSETDIMTDNITLEPAPIGVPDDIVSIAGPYLNRMFFTVADGYIYVSSNKSPSNCSAFHIMDGRRYGDPLWSVKTTQGIYVGFSKDVCQILGSGDVNEDGTIIDFFLQPLNVGNPPVGRAVTTDGSTILYQSADGLMIVTGSMVTPVPKQGTQLLWRGQERYGQDPLRLSETIVLTSTALGAATSATVIDLSGFTGVSAVNDTYNGMYVKFDSGDANNTSVEIKDYNGTTKRATVDTMSVPAASGDMASVIIQPGRFRMCIDNQIVYMLATEGSSLDPTSVWRYNLPNQDWARFTYDSHPLLSIFRASSGEVLGGTRDGRLVLLEDGTQGSDDGSPVTVDILYPWQEGNHPLARKVPNDFLIHSDTGGETGTFSVENDDGVVHLEPFSAVGEQHYRSNVSDILPFLHAQTRIYGDFYSFRLQEWNLSYRPLVQHMMSVDTDYIVPPDPADIVWLQELEVDCISPSNLTVDIYIDDTLYDTRPLVVQPNKRSMYIVPLKRGTKGRRPRVRISTTASNGAGEVGFELFRVRYRHAGSGNMYEIPFQTVDPTGGQ